jgi:hypothetical protein
MLSCRDVTEIATEFTEGKLAFRRRMALQLHLAMCGGCRRFVDQLRTTAVLLRRVPAPEGSAESQGELAGRFADWVGAAGSDGGSAGLPEDSQ